VNMVLNLHFPQQQDILEQINNYQMLKKNYAHWLIS